MIKKCLTFVSVWKVLAGGRGAYKIQIYIMGTAIQQTFLSKGIFIMSLVGFMFLWGAQWMERMYLHSKEFVYISLLSGNEPPPPPLPIPMGRAKHLWPPLSCFNVRICYAMTTHVTVERGNLLGCRCGPYCSLFSLLFWMTLVCSCSTTHSCRVGVTACSFCVCVWVCTPRIHIWFESRSVRLTVLQYTMHFHAVQLSFIRGSPLCVIVKQLCCIINGSLGW